MKIYNLVHSINEQGEKQLIIRDGLVLLGCFRLVEILLVSGLLLLCELLLDLDNRPFSFQRQFRCVKYRGQLFGI